MGDNQPSDADRTVTLPLRSAVASLRIQGSNGVLAMTSAAPDDDRQRCQHRQQPPSGTLFLARFASGVFAALFG